MIENPMLNLSSYMNKIVIYKTIQNEDMPMSTNNCTSAIPQVLLLSIVLIYTFCKGPGWLNKLSCWI